MTEVVGFARVELRSAAPGFVVGLAVPFDEISYLTDYPEGERFAGGAFTFDEVAATAGRRYPVVVDHDDRLRVGTVVHLQEVRQGLLAGIRFDDRPEARGAAEMAARGPVGLSVAFYPVEVAKGVHGERVVVSARLDHLAFVSVPAYAGAETFLPSAAALVTRSAATRVRSHVPPHLAGLWK